MPEVLIAGAGPTGLLLAVELQRRGVPCELIDAHDAPMGWDRATIVHSRSMEIFESLGLADRFLEEGVRSGAVRIRSDGEVLGLKEFNSLNTRYPFDLGVSEQVTESILTEYLESLGGEVIRGNRLVGLTPGTDSVTATLERHGERCEVEASWVVGCDGFHSATREQAGIEFPVTGIEAWWAVFDATMEGWPEEFEVQNALLDVPPVILTPLPGRRWRAYVRPKSEESDLVEEVAGVINRYFPDVKIANVQTPSRFKCHARIASAYRAGRVLLAGDAAHVCTPAEGHGMNTGLQDAYNLGWKLAAVVSGESGPAILDSYEVERRPVAEMVIASGDDAEGGQALTSPEDRAARDAEIRGMLADPETAHHDAAASAEFGRSYADSAIVAGEPNESLAPGERLPDTDPVEPWQGQPCPLHELTHHPGQTVLVIGGQDGTASEVAELVRKLEDEVAEVPLASAVVGLAVNPNGEPVGRIEAALADELGIRDVTVLAIRPDRYVGLRDDNGDPGAVREYLETLKTGG